MLLLYRKLDKILDKREKRLALFVLLITVVVAVVDVLGVASIMPFMIVLSNPDVIDSNTVLSYVYTTLGFESKKSYLFFLGVIVFVLLVGSTFLRGILVWVQVHYANLRIYSISTRLVSGYLNKPYCWFLSNNTSKLTSSIIEEVNRVVHGVLHPVLRVISNGLIALLVIALLMIVDPTLTLSVAAVLGISYAAILKFVSSRLTQNGHYLTIFQRGRHKAIQEAFGGIKDVKLVGLEASFLEKYRVQTLNFALKSVANKLWSEMPSFGIQGLVFGGMMLVILYLMRTSGTFEEIIPVLSLYALAGYKLMPSLQELYKQIAQIKGNLSALDSIVDDIREIDTSQSVIGVNRNDRLSLNALLELRDITFKYAGSSKLILNELTLSIEKNTTVGFVGGSGAGKTTTVDIILGLLSSDQGELLVDGRVVDEKCLRAWQNNIGYVPQHIYLTDDSISANIAYGIPDEEIEIESVKRAAKTANLHEFIETELPDGYETQAGERGVKFSGGQRQRIGIARALYHDPDILILDEATSALDNVTEKVVMDAVRELGHKKTIILVAHRLSTVQSCDRIFYFENGKVTASGTYEELLDNSEKFRELALLKG